LSVVLDDVREDDGGADVVLQPVEELAVGQPLLDEGRAAALGPPERLAKQTGGLTLDVDHLPRDLLDALRRRGRPRDREGEQRERRSSESRPARHHSPPGSPALSPSAPRRVAWMRSV